MFVDKRDMSTEDLQKLIHYLPNFFADFSLKEPFFSKVFCIFKQRF